MIHKISSLVKVKIVFFCLSFLFIREIIVLDELNANMTLDSNIEVYFSPGQQCEKEIIEDILQASKSIDIAIYYFTSKNIAKSLLTAKSKGVNIRIYCDEGMKKYRYSQVSLLASNNIPIKFESFSGLMHNKFFIIDKKTVITGSYNLTVNAKRNEENIIVLHNTEVANIYSDQFERYWGKTA